MKKIYLLVSLFIYGYNLSAQVIANIVNTPDCKKEGEIALVIKIGTPPYSINWSSGQKSSYITNLSAGNYCVTITDNYCCEFKECYEVKTGSFLKLSVTTKNATACDKADGSFTINSLSTTGVTAPIVYRWYWYKNGTMLELIGTGNPPNFSTQNLLSGKYRLEATSADGCHDSVEFSIGAPDEINVTFKEGLAPCNNNGELEAKALPAIAGNYNFTWTKPVQTNNGVASSKVIQLSQSIYSVFVQRAQDKRCGKNYNYTFIPKPFKAENLNVILKHTCLNKTNGSITIGLLPPANLGSYTFKWSSNIPASNAIGIANNLKAGIYSVTATDPCGQTVYRTIEIKEENHTLNLISSDVDCTTDIIANLPSFNAPVTYLWNNGATTNSISNVPNGTYSVTATDVNGCSAVKSQTVAKDFSYKVSVTNQPCEGSLGSGKATITFGPNVKPPIAVYLGKSNIPLVNVNNALTAQFTLDPYTTIHPTVEIGTCLSYPTITVEQKKLDEIFSSYNSTTNVCTYNRQCNGEDLGTSSGFAYNGIAQGGWLQKCKHDIYCYNYQDPKNNFKVGSKSYPKQSNKVGKYLVILEVAYKSQLIDEATYQQRINEVTKEFDSMCDKVRFCTTPGAGGFQIWDINLFNGFGSDGPFKGAIQSIEPAGCYKLYCPEPLKIDNEFCLKDILPDYMSNITLAPPVFVKDCQLRNFSFYQIILWHDDIITAYPNYLGSKLYDAVVKYKDDPRAKCALVSFCHNDFSIRKLDIEAIDCKPIFVDYAHPNIPPDEIATCEEECFEDKNFSDCTRLKIECNTDKGTVFVSTKFPGTNYFKTYNPNGSNSLDPLENIKFSSFNPTELTNISVARSSEGILPNGLTKSGKNHLFLDYNHSSYNKRELEIPNVTHLIDDYTDDFWIYTEQVDSNIVALNYDSEGTTWVKQLTSKNYLKIENLSDKNNITTICGYFNGTLLANDKVLGKSKNGAVFVLRYNHEGILQSSNFIENINQGLHSTVLNGKVYLNAQVAGKEINLDNQVLSEFPNNPIVNIVIDENGKTEKVLGNISLGENINILKSAISSDGTKSIFLLNGKGNVTTDTKTIYSNSNDNTFTLLSLKNDGSVAWTKTLSGTIDAQNTCITFDDADKIFLGISFEGNLTFQKSNYKSKGQYDILLLQLNDSGGIISTKQYGSVDNEKVSHFLRDGRGVLYFGGNYEGRTQSRIIGNYQFVNSAKLDLSQAFISYIFEKDFMKKNDDIPVDTRVQKNTILTGNEMIGVKVYPNPFNQNLFVNIESAVKCSYSIELLDVLGKTVWNKNDTGLLKTASYEIEVANNIPNGIYFLQVKGSNGYSTVQRVVKQ